MYILTYSGISLTLCLGLKLMRKQTRRFSMSIRLWRIKLTTGEIRDVEESQARWAIAHKLARFVDFVWLIEDIQPPSTPASATM
jgi:hypothetical protein